MAYKNIGTADLAWKGRVIQPGAQCPDDADAAWLSYFVKEGVLAKDQPPVIQTEKVKQVERASKKEHL